jgi:hypothetical protein
MADSKDLSQRRKGFLRMVFGIITRYEYDMSSLSDALLTLIGDAGSEHRTG